MEQNSSENTLPILERRFANTFVFQTVPQKDFKIAIYPFDYFLEDVF